MTRGGHRPAPHFLRLQNLRHLYFGNQSNLRIPNRGPPRANPGFTKDSVAGSHLVAGFQTRLDPKEFGNFSFCRAADRKWKGSREAGIRIWRGLEPLLLRWQNATEIAVLG